MKHCTYGGQEMIKRRSFLTVFDGDWTQLIAEPDGWHNAVTVTVRNVILLGGAPQMMNKTTTVNQQIKVHTVAAAP